MKILLDTNALIWWMEDNPRLGPRARNLLANPANETFASLVSVWEITIKWRIGKHHSPGSPYMRFMAEEGVAMVSVTPDHIAAVEGLDFCHKDPFDHLILAQAKVEGAAILTSDRAMADYGVRCIPTA
ncbi:MAG: type II toxin-antitoxin system VapC family toxin [Sphingomonadaceae bacterium]